MCYYNEMKKKKGFLYPKKVTFNFHSFMDMRVNKKIFFLAKNAYFKIQYFLNQIFNIFKDKIYDGICLFIRKE